MRKIEAIRVEGDRRAQSHYSTAIRAGAFLYLSGLGPLDPDARIVGRTIEEQTRATMENLAEVLRAAGATLADLVSVRVYLADLDDYGAFNRVYEEYVVQEPYPARICLEAGRLWSDVRVELEGVAYLPSIRNRDDGGSET
jgi:2-iminobutanoate/2-iminopropanoate deaminase